MLPTDLNEHEVRVSAFFGNAFLDTKVFDKVADLLLVSTCSLHCISIMLDSSSSQSAINWSKSKFGSAGCEFSVWCSVYAGSGGEYGFPMEECCCFLDVWYGVEQQQVDC